MGTNNSLNANTGGAGPDVSMGGGSRRSPLALIAGPTASGKSDLAVRLALGLRARGREAVIVNADSAQIYRDLPVLSACPRPEEQRGIAHRLFAFRDGAEACSAAEWADLARGEITRAQARGAVPVLVGGTGLYIRTLLEGIAPVPAIDPEVRATVRALPVAEAHAALVREDAERAARLHPSDTTRVARALEVVRSTGVPLGIWQARREGGIGDRVALAPLVLLPDRARLYERCDARFVAMLGGGAVAEVEALLARGLDPALPVMRAIGVAEIAGWLGSEWSEDEALRRGQQATRHYAKRQFTWLRHQPPADWPRVAPENVDKIQLIEILLHE